MFCGSFSLENFFSPLFANKFPILNLVSNPNDCLVGFVYDITWRGTSGKKGCTLALAMFCNNNENYDNPKI